MVGGERGIKDDSYITGLSNLPLNISFTEIGRSREEQVEAGRENQGSLFVIFKMTVRYPRQADIRFRRVFS